MAQVDYSKGTEVCNVDTDTSPNRRAFEKHMKDTYKLIDSAFARCEPNDRYLLAAINSKWRTWQAACEYKDEISRREYAKTYPKSSVHKEW